MLCADCDNATAVRRAEEIRKNIWRISQPLMRGKSVSASFGVTEIQPGDSPSTMLRRADRALLTAKARGRNRVVQLGIGSMAERPWLLSGSAADESQKLIEQDMISSVPMAVAFDKFRGFAADHRAKFVNDKWPNVCLEMQAQPLDGRQRRSTDRYTTFVINLNFEECTDEIQKRKCGSSPAVDKLPKTKIGISISPKRNRNRRQGDILDQAREILISFRSYLMVTDEQDQEEEHVKLQNQQFVDSWRYRQLAPLDDGDAKPSIIASIWQSIRRYW